jgi:hypothetical protein
MAIKGVTWIEQHFEKIVLGAVSATALGILGWQFVGRQSTISINNKQVALDQANAELKAKALEVRGKIKDTNPKLPEKFPVTRIADDFKARYAAPVTPARRLGAGGDGRFAWNPSGISLGTRSGPVVADRGPINPVQVPVPARLIAEPSLATVLRGQLDKNEPIPTEPTEADLVDIAWVSIEGAFDGAALAAALKADPDGPDGPARPMPEHWWGSSMALLGFEIERQELLPSGEWGPAAPVKPAKFGLSLLERTRDPEFDGSKLREMITLANSGAEMVRRPLPPAAPVGEPWVPPSEVAKGNPSAAEIGKLRREIDDLQSQISKIDDQLKKLPTDERNAPTRKSLEDRKRPLATKLVEKSTRYNQLLEGPKAAAPSGETPKAEPLLASSNIRFWVHDTDVKRNTAYRYRLRAVVNNPAFGQGAALGKDQQDLAKTPIARSEPSEWTQPVRVDPDLYYFITSADDNKGGNLTQIPVATAEVFSFNQGYWRTESIRLQPGDPLVAEIEVPPLGHVAKVAVNDNGSPGAGEPPISETPRSTPGRGGGTSGKGARGGGGGGERQPPRPREREEAPKPPPPGQKDGAKPAPVKNRVIPVSVPVYLLDVAAAPAAGNGSADRHQAFLRALDGTIEIRIPDDDRQTRAYQRVRASSELAKLGGIRQVEVPAEPTKPPVDEKIPKAPPPPGGG